MIFTLGSSSLEGEQLFVLTFHLFVLDMWHHSQTSETLPTSTDNGSQSINIDLTAQHFINYTRELLIEHWLPWWIWHRWQHQTNAEIQSMHEYIERQDISRNGWRRQLGLSYCCGMLLRKSACLRHSGDAFRLWCCFHDQDVKWPCQWSWEVTSGAENAMNLTSNSPAFTKALSSSVVRRKGGHWFLSESNNNEHLASRIIYQQTASTLTVEPICSTADNKRLSMLCHCVRDISHLQPSTPSFCPSIDS